MLKHTYILLLAVVTVFTTHAQTYYHVSHASGKQSIGGIDVGVAPVNGAYTYAPGQFCGAGPYFIGQGGGGAATSGYNFIFSKPIYAARFQITASETGEYISFDVNNIPYNLAPSQVTNFTGYCGNPNGWLVSNGQISFPSTLPMNNSQVYIVDSITSITIYDVNYSAGSVFNFDFVLDTVAIIDSISDNMLCIGDSLLVKFTAAGTFFNGNQFILQLSDKNGNFASSQTLGTISSIVSGTFNCVLPAIPSGEGYKLRIVSTLPADTSRVFATTLSIGNPPLIQAFSTSPGCEGDTMKVGVNEFSHVTERIWNGPGLLPNFLTRVATLIDVKLSDAGMYYVTVQDNGCEAIDSTYLEIHPNPVQSISFTNSPVCEGDTLKLYGNIDSAGVENIWMLPLGGTLKGKDVAIPNIQFGDSGQYVLATKLNGCTAKDTTYIIVKPTPYTYPAVNSPLCEGNKIILNANCAVKNAIFSWSGPKNFTMYHADTIIDNAATWHSGMYTVSAYSNGCATTQSLNVQVNAMPDIPAGSSNYPVCEHSDLVLTARNINQAADYSWSGPEGYIAYGYDAIRKDINIASSGKYIIKADSKGCITTDTIDVKVVELPPVPDIISNSPLHIGDELQLHLKNALSGIVYKWMGPYGFSTTEAHPVINSALKINSGRYTLMANRNGCYSQNHIDVVVDEVTDTGTIVLYPNANDGNFTVKALLTKDQDIKIRITDETGHQLYTLRTATQNKILEASINLKNTLSSGIYYLWLAIDGTIKSIPFVVNRQ